MDRSLTMQGMLEDIFYLFCNFLCTVFIGGIVTSVFQNKQTQIQLALGVLKRIT